MTKLFLTGATGYVGGDALYHLSSAALKLNISALVRDKSKAAEVAAIYPHIRIVLGDLDDAELIEEEARNADIVLRIDLAATGHIASAKAIAKGLSEAGKPGYWIQISGATLFAGDEIAKKIFGQKSNKVYDDLGGAEEVLSVISKFPNRTVDNLIVAQDPSKVKTALLIGPLIYGVGRGPGNQRSIQAPEIARVTLKYKTGFKLEAGQNAWSSVHVHHLSDLSLHLVEVATAQKDGYWNKDGIYCPETGAVEFGTLCEDIAVEAANQGLIPHGTATKRINAEEADRQSGHASILWGTNAVQKSSRARKNLKWNPTGLSLEKEIPIIVAAEGKA